MYGQQSILSKAVPFKAFAGGLFLASHYVLHLVYGVQTGNILWDAMESPLGKFDGSVFSAAFATIDIALIFLILAYSPKLKNLKYVALFFGVVAFLAAMTGFIAFTFTGKMVPFAMPVACLTMFLSAIFLSITCFKSKVLPTWIRYALVVFGVCTAPLGWLLPKVFAAAPAYVSFELHFFPMGILWMAIGVAMALENRKQRQMLAKRMEALQARTFAN